MVLDLSVDSFLGLGVMRGEGQASALFQEQPGEGLAGYLGNSFVLKFPSTSQRNREKRLLSQETENIPTLMLIYCLPSSLLLQHLVFISFATINRDLKISNGRLQKLKNHVLSK